MSTDVELNKMKKKISRLFCVFKFCGAFEIFWPFVRINGFKKMGTDKEEKNWRRKIVNVKSKKKEEYYGRQMKRITNKISLFKYKFINHKKPPCLFQCCSSCDVFFLVS